VNDRKVIPAPPLAAAAGLSRVLVERTRMAMREPSYSYDLYVPEPEAPEHVRTTCSRFIILPDHSMRERFIDYVDATCSAAHCAMPTGWDRYQDWLEHERRAYREALGLARAAFPELRAFNGDALPRLWIGMPSFRDGTHAEAWLTFGT
jgi:hypothetical protein